MKRACAIALWVALATPALAARDSGGTYSRPAGNPVTTGTPITSTWANALTADLATELTDSLSRSGKGPLLAPLKLYSGGSATTPELVWNDDSNSGFYLIGNDNVGLSIGGTKRWDFAASTSTLTGALTVSGAATLQSTADVTGNATVGGTLGVTGATTLTGLATLSGGIAGAVVDGSSLELNSNAIRVKDLGITTAKIADANVTRAKLAAVGMQVGASSGTFTTTSTTRVDVTNLSVTLTTSGRPVVVALVATGGVVPSSFSIQRKGGSGNAYGELYLMVDATTFGGQTFGVQSAAVGVQYAYPAGLFHIDTAAVAGTYTYKVQAKCFGADMSLGVNNVSLLAYEL
jgi:hypothetical protein